MIYQEHILQSQQLFCRIFYSTNAPCQRLMLEHRHAAPELALVLSGSGIYQTKDRAYCFGDGDIFFFSANEVHYVTKIDSDQPFLLFNVQFSFERPAQEVYHAISRKDGLFFSGGRLPGETAADEGMAPPMKQLHCEYTQRRAGWELVVESGLLAFLGWLIRYNSENQLLVQHVQRKNDYEWMTRAINYISEHLTEDLDLKTLARAAGLSKTYFSVMFHESRGVCVWEYITEKRIELAMEWLVGSNCPITEVATRCGFNYTTNFYRAFRKRTGQSPTAFRKAAAATMEKV